MEAINKINAMENYRELLQKFKYVKQQVKDLIDQFPENKREEILFDKWSLKDVVAHLNHWMVHDIDCLENLLKGEEPYWEPDVEEFNTKGVNARKDKSWDELYVEFTGLIEKLTKLYENLPEELQNKKIWKDKDETPLKFLEEDIHHWEGEHIPALEKVIN